MPWTLAVLSSCPWVRHEDLALPGRIDAGLLTAAAFVVATPKAKARRAKAAKACFGAGAP